MKKIAILVTLAITTSSCSIFQSGIEKQNWLGKNFTVYNLTNDEQNNFVTSAERKEQTLMSLKATDNAYPKLMFDPNSTVIKFEKNKKASKLANADDFYKEEIFLEIPSQPFSKKYKDQEIDSVKLIYGKHCYCKGLAGYYRISKGDLKIKHEENSTYIKISFPEPNTDEMKEYSFEVEK